MLIYPYIGVYMLNEENKLNIAMFSDSFFPTMGGREKVIDYSMRELIKDNNAFLCAPKIKNKKYAEFSDSNLPYKVYRCNSIRIFNESYLAICNRKFRKEVEKLKFDIIHCQTKYALLNYAFKLRKKFNVPVVTSVHTNYLYIYTKQMPKFIRNIALKYVVKQMNKCDKVIAVSNYMKNQIISLGVKSDIVVIKNGTNFKETELFDKNYIRNYYNIDDDTFVLLYVGRIIEEKNIAFQLEVIKRLKELTNKKFLFLLVGDGKELQKFKKMTKSLEIENNVKFLGQINDTKLLFSIYKQSDLFFFSSLSDNDPLTIVEAAFNSVPSLVVEKTGGAERIINNENGFITANDKEEIANKIIEILDNKYDLKSIGENAKNTIPKSWEIVTQSYLEEYKKTIETFKRKNNLNKK